MANTLETAPPESTSRDRGMTWAWIVFAVVLIGEIMDLLDSVVTTIAGPTILRQIGGSDSFIQWLSAGYTISMAAGLLIGGRLGDIFGRKRMLLIGMAGFTTMSLVAAVSVSPGMLISARLLQGLLGALMLPQGLGLIKETFPPEKAGAAFGAFGPVMGLSAVGGPILAGWLIDADYFGWGWRMIFAINVPLGIIGFVLGLRYLPAAKRHHERSIDVIGAILAAVGFAAITYPLVQGRELGWPAWVFVMLIGGVGSLVAFGWHQIRRDASGRSTLVVPTLFHKRAFNGALVVGVFFFGALMGSGLIYSLFLQFGLGLSPLRAGLTTVAQAIGMIVGFFVSQKLGASRRTMLIGTIIVFAGQLAVIATIAGAGNDFNAWWLSPALAIVGIGMGITMAPFFDIVLGAVSDAEAGSASGTLTAVQQVGGSIGVAVVGTVFFSALNHTSATHVATYEHATIVSILITLVLVAASFALTFALPKAIKTEVPAVQQ